MVILIKLKKPKLVGNNGHCKIGLLGRELIKYLTEICLNYEKCNDNQKYLSR